MASASSLSPSATRRCSPGDDSRPCAATLLATTGMPRAKAFSIFRRVPPPLRGRVDEHAGTTVQRLGILHFADELGTFGSGDARRQGRRRARARDDEPGFGHFAATTGKTEVRRRSRPSMLGCQLSVPK